MKYKNPPVTKNIVCFENMVNWNDQIIVEQIEAKLKEKNAW
jgi:hypothetical protein